MKLSSVYVTVDNMQRALAFYEKLFGVSPDVRDNRYSSFLLPEGGKFDLYYPFVDEQERSIGTNVIPVFYLKDLDAEYKRLTDLGVLIVQEPESIGHVRLFQFEDTEGNTLEFYSENH